MHTSYEDIMSRIPEEPIWFDEHAVPRYIPFAPREAANIYARFVALLLIACQGCGREFRVAMSQSSMGRYGGFDRDGALIQHPAMDDAFASGNVGWGDPPNVSCCGAGPSMSSEARQVLEFWESARSLDWQRRPDLEAVDVTPEWAR